MFLVLFFHLLNLTNQPAEAQVIAAFVREQVGTLPKGRFLVSVVGVSSAIDQSYGQDGVKKPLSQNLNQNISFQKIANDEKARTRQLGGLFKANQVSLSDSAGSLSGNISGTMSGKIPVVGYGISDSVGVYLSIPIIHFNILSQYQFNQSPATQAFLAKLQSTDQSSTKREFENALNTSLEHKLYQSTYAWTPALNRDYLGDVQINLSKVLLSDAGEMGVKQLFQPILVLPTADDQDMHDLYGLKAGDRRLGLGMKYGVQSKLPANLQGNFSVSGTYLFANQQARRIPSSSDDLLNENLDPNTQVSGGSKLQSQLQLRYQFPKWLALNSGILWQKKMNETLSGSSFDPSLYDYASQKSGYELLSSYFSLDLNSIQSFIEGHFLFPAVAELGLGLPLAGKNSIAEPVLEFQTSMFF